MASMNGAIGLPQRSTSPTHAWSAMPGIESMGRKIGVRKNHGSSAAASTGSTSR